MHVLTKLFVVLVSLMVVMLVPLVVVYAHNENSFQARYRAAKAQAAAARSAFESAQATQGAVVMRKDATIEEMGFENRQLRQQLDQADAELRQIASRLSAAEDLDAEIRAQLATLSSAVDAGQDLNQSLIDELRTLRKDALAAERQKVELDEALREKMALLDAAVEARRALQEELQRLKDEHAGAMQTIGGYQARYGQLDTETLAVTEFPQISVDATIIQTRYDQDQSLAEIDAGSRDGLQEGWVLTIGRGSEFIARLKLIRVDINRSTGIIELERDRVRVGDRAMARPQ